MSTRYEIFAAVTPGLEAALSTELAELLPSASLRANRGGVSLRGDRESLWTLCAGSRLAETVRVRVGHFDARDFAALEAGLGRLPWSAYLARNAPVTVQVTARKSALYHSGAISDRVVRALDRPVTAPGEGGCRVWVRLVKDRATISVDAGGGLLHRRGWRKDVVRAPLRETLAAACVRLAGLPSGGVIWDPFCGSGTLLIEAGLMAVGAAAQQGREYAFEGWPTHHDQVFARWPGPRLPAPGGLRVFGTDLKEDAIGAAQANSVRAGVSERCTWLTGDFAAHTKAIPEGAAIVTNPPYGKRLGGGARLQSLFRRFGELLQSRHDLRTVVVLVGSRGFEAATGLPWDSLAEFSNRGTPTRLLRLRR